MAYGLVNDDTARNQYTALAGETNFAYNFKIFEDGDLNVWLTPVGQTPDPVLDLLSLNVDYTVTDAGAIGGGNVVLVTPATAGDIITIERDIPIERTFDYSVGGTFTADSINEQLDKLTMTQQQNETVNEKRQLTYYPTDELTTGDLALPKLSANQIWTKSAAGALIAADITESTGWSTLRSELANDLSGADGSRIVGYYDSHTGSTTVHAVLESIGVEGSKYAITAGTQPNYTATVSNVTSYYAGLTIQLKMHASNAAGASTININSLGAKNLVRSDGNTFATNDLLINLVYTFIYQGTEFILSNIQAANETSKGLIELATTAEVKAATDTSRAVVPVKMINHPGVAKAWVTFDGAGTILKSYNITSVTRTAPGAYDIVLAITMADANYCVTACDKSVAPLDGGSITIDSGIAMTPTTLSIVTLDQVWARADKVKAFVAIYGELA